MLDAIAREDDSPLVIHSHRDREHDRTLWIPKPLGDSVGDICVRQRELVLRDRGLEERRVPLEIGLGRCSLQRPPQECIHDPS